MKQVSNLNCYEWFGEFFYPDNNRVRFAGKLSYDPKIGLRFEYLIDHLIRSDCPANAPQIYGILQDGTPCTLIGNFTPPDQESHNYNCRFFTGIGYFEVCILGYHCEASYLFSEIHLFFHNFDEFCYPECIRSQAPNLEQPVFNVKVNDFCIELNQYKKYGLAGENISNIFHSSNKAFLKDFQAAIEQTTVKHKVKYLDYRKEISYRFDIISAEKGKTVTEWLRIMYQLKALFSVLFFIPVYPTNFLIKSPSINKSQGLPILFDSSVSEKDISLIERKIEYYKFNFLFPSIENTMQNILLNWFYNYDDYRYFIGHIILHNSFENELEIDGSYVLLVTQFESISSKFIKGKDLNKMKYEFPIRKYANYSLLIDYFKKLLAVDTMQEIGKQISSLRGEITHIGKPKVLTKTISLFKRSILCECFKIIIASFIYEQLGIDEKVILRFQEKQVAKLPHISNFE